MTPPRRSSSSASASAAAASSTEKFHVFEFNEEDACIEMASERILGKFANPKKNRGSPITKYTFLQVFAQGPKSLHKDISSDPIDLDAEAHEIAQELNSSLEDSRSKPLEAGSCGMDHKCAQDNSCSVDASLQENTAKEMSSLDGFQKSNLEFGNDSHDLICNDDISSQMSASSTSTSTSTSEDIEVFFEGKLMDYVSAAFEINGEKKVVDVNPDFILYGDIYSTDSRLTFSCSSVKLEGSAVNGSGETYKFEWSIDNVIKIVSCWCEQVETAMINLFLTSEDSREAGNENHNQGFKELKFAVYDPCWSKLEEAVKSLDVRYADIWNDIFDLDTDNEKNSQFGQNSHVSQMRYLPIFDETFDEIIYPKGDADAVSLSKRDIELLQPETFINDNIIDFYIKYLKNKIPPNEQNRFHFFNCFFFRKLADLDKDPPSACDGKAAFQRVRKWTRKVNLFEKDCIFVPINYSLHWSLIVICHPGEVACFQDEEIKESSKVPCILHMDSLRGSHKGLKNVFQSYLCEEWKERHRDMVDDVSSKFLHLRFVSLELPQQENLYDCGLFLLHYVERFLNEAPINFNPFKITKFSDLSKWFPPVEASLKRAHIQELIYDVFQDNSPKVLPNDCISKSSLSEDKMEAGTFGGSCHLTLCGGNSFFSAKQGTNIRFSVASPTRVVSSIREREIFSMDLQGTVGDSSSANFQRVITCHQRGFMSPIEEIDEDDEETTVSPLLMEDSQLALSTSDFPSTSYLRSSEASLQGFSMNFKDANDAHSHAPWNTLETETQENCPQEKTEGSNPSDKNDMLEQCSSASSEELADCIVQDSQEANDMEDDVVASVKSPSSLEVNGNPCETINLEDDESVCKTQPPACESGERDAKRRRLVDSEGEKPITRSLFKGSCLMSM
ncbi:probable ubiquitin-like-specific protease 2A isoform X2 [Prosopis cineraria]|uniref:probable ubiquitin-like-specific protease 2A isoform X2 n=1 Tax=Prosopis cineraria TaxID=364024 RepID=UPI00240F94F5|nr:probable ubiquitin-like-specific protease 2A isoform X2 [Prosopis cineraria]